MNMLNWMAIATVGGLVSLTFSDLAVACVQALGADHAASRHARMQARRMKGLWVAAVAGGVRTLQGD